LNKLYIIQIEYFHEVKVLRVFLRRFQIGPKLCKTLNAQIPVGHAFRDFSG
jgi:hypothetical protein